MRYSFCDCTLYNSYSRYGIKNVKTKNRWIENWLQISFNFPLKKFIFHKVIKKWKYSYVPSHFRPCRKIPYSKEPQWSQNVGDINVCTRNRCGKSILNRSRRYFWENKHKIGQLIIRNNSTSMHMYFCIFYGKEIFTSTYDCTFWVKPWFGTCTQQLLMTLFMHSCLTLYS